MKKPDEVIDLIDNYRVRIETELREFLASQKKLEMYDMMSYFLGFRDENLNEAEIYGGKRFRSAICMLIASFYGSEEDAIEVASSIELFHNFTLIHDDIVDNDPLRRGRPTVWKLFGVDHAINSGDAQLILTSLELNRGACKLKNGHVLEDFLLGRFLEVAEGQYLDFSLTSFPIDDIFVNEENYLEMITKKTSVLVGASTAAGGMVADVSAKEKENLWQYGLNLGIAYQICDDLVSIWGDPNVTGKISHNDIREKKKTLPIIYLYSRLSEDEKRSFTAIYNKEGDLTDKEIESVISLLEEYGAYEYTWQRLTEFQKKSLDAADRLKLGKEKITLLKQINKALLPNIKEIVKC